MPKALHELTGELERAVFLSVYRSRRQRLRRLLAVHILLLKHMLSALLYLWPAYAVLIGLMWLPLEPRRWFYLGVLIPGLLIWLIICIKGTRRDYTAHVDQRLLNPGYIKDLFVQ
jgi:hypothetical protein